MSKDEKAELVNESPEEQAAGRSEGRGLWSDQLWKAHVC